VIGILLGVSGHSCFFAEGRRKDENKRPQTTQCLQISKKILPTTSSARSARSAPGGQPVPRNWLDRPACSSTWFDSGASLWSNRLPPKALRRSDAHLQHVGLQFGKGSGMHLCFASAARECLVMKRETLAALFPSLSDGRRSSLMDPFRDDERRFRTAPATHRIFVRVTNRFRSITSANKKPITRQPKHHSLDLARGGATGGGARRAEMPLRTEQVASFADVSRAKRSNLDSSATKPGT
jgi:hypothetical protein